MYYMFVFGSARRAPTLPSVCGDKFEVHEVSSKVWARVHVPCVMCGDFFSRTNSPLGPNIACLQHWIYFVDVGVSPGKRYTSDFFASSSFFFLRSLVLFILSICLVTSFAPKVAYIQTHRSKADYIWTQNSYNLPGMICVWMLFSHRCWPLFQLLDTLVVLAPLPQARPEGGTLYRVLIACAGPAYLMPLFPSQPQFT